MRYDYASGNLCPILRTTFYKDGRDGGKEGTKNWNGMGGLFVFIVCFVSRG